MTKAIRRTKKPKETYFKTREQIEAETGRDFKELVLELLDQGMAPIEIVKQYQLKSTGVIDSIMTMEKRKQQRQNLTNDDFVLPDLFGLSYKEIEERFRNELGIEYKDWLKQKYFDEKLSQNEISLLLNVSVQGVHRVMDRYGIRKTTSQARQDAISKGLIDYNNVKIKARKTKEKSNGYSNIQEIFRELIKYHLESKINQIDNINIEVIIGFNEWGILKDREVDIPIIIVINNNQFLKYSIEYNGTGWHDRKETIKDDKKKQKDLLNKGWKHFTYKENTNQSKNMSTMEIEVSKIADQIANDILNNTIINTI